MHFFTTALLALASSATVSANNYTLFCGDSCTSGLTVVNTGSDYSGASCSNFDTPYAYCYLESDETFYKAIISKGESCSESQEQVFRPGDCNEGPWESYQVSVNL